MSRAILVGLIVACGLVWAGLARADVEVCSTEYVLGGTVVTCHVVKGPRVREPKSFTFGAGK